MERISLCEGWLFRKLPDADMQQTSPAALPEEGWTPVTLPHTWYTDDDQYRGLSAYRRTVEWEQGRNRAFLSFEGADQCCRVYADGALLGEHRGGYSRFRFPLERPVSGFTELTVLLDNRLDETVSPHFGDFTIFGGFYRPVELLYVGDASFDYGYYGADGLLVWAEIPMLKMTEDQALFENAKEQLRELILQNLHHPSIFCWGIQNEIAMFRDAPFMHEQCAALSALVRELDPGRYSACANLYPLKPKSKLNELTDLVGYNLYFGWYYGEMGDYANYLDRFHAARPALPLGISEYGVDCNLALHSETPRVKDYSEEYQALWHETVYPQIEARKWLWGSFIWNMFDFSSARRNEGGLRFVNGKGLVTRDRLVKKDAFYYYKARWARDPFVYLCSRRFAKRCAETVTVKVYTNQPEVTLTVNGAPFGTAKNDGNGTVRFADVPLQPGENRVEARASSCYDALTWERVETPEASYALPESGGGAVKNWFLSDDDITRQGYYSLNDTANDVLDEPAARAVLEKYVPGMVRAMESGKIPLGLTVKNILSFGNTVEPETLKAINAELNQIENLF